MKKLKNVSASQLHTFNRCRRKWAWEKLAGKRGPSTHAQRRGTAIHHALEQYATDGQILDEVVVDETSGQVSAKGTDVIKVKRFVMAIKDLIDEEEIVELEGKISLETFPGGPPWLGFIDVLAAERVIDYKTTSNFRYAKTPGDLLNDPQACSYVLSVFRKYPEAKEFDVRFIYLQTSNKVKVNVKVVNATFTRADCERVFEDAVVSVREMVQLSKITKDPNTVEANLKACMDFGGCPHRTYCDRVEEDLLEKPKVKGKPNRFTHPELFKKKKELTTENEVVSFRPPEVKKDE